MTGELAMFVSAALVVTLAPGPDNLGTLSIGLSGGRARALAFAVGCALGCLTHTCWAAIGVTAVLAASTVAFTVLKVLGAGYLFHLGILALRHAGRSTISDASSEPSAEVPSQFLLRGFVANAINPKVALFFLAFLPQFVRADNSIAKPLQIVILGLTFSGVTVVIFGAIALFAGQIGDWLRRRPGVGRRLDQVTGILFIALGIRLLMQRQ